MPASYRIHRVGPDDWPRIRQLRLAALQDAPTAFGQRYEDALVAPDELWQIRAARAAAGPDAMQVIAVTGDGEWVGMMTGLREESDDGSYRATIVGVWVHPDHRGAGREAQALLDAVIEWAADEAKVDHIDLCVTEANARAIGFYRRNGFRFTGGHHPYENDRSLRELEMTRAVIVA